MGLLGINIGPNKDTKDRTEDYIECLKTFNDVADYITINISSPNTDDLRNFHNQTKLDELLKILDKEKKKLIQNSYCCKNYLQILMIKKLNKFQKFF